MSDDDDYLLPDDLPKPENDGAADHLPNAGIPPIALPATDGSTVTLADLPGRTVVYCYPKTGRPDKDVIPEGWDQIPGARGCTPEACSFRNHYQELLDREISEVFGLSLQSTEYQQEARDRLHLPFELLSDVDLHLTHRHNLPIFEVEGETYLKRLTLVINGGTIEHVFYPVFPPNEHASEVLRWVDHHRSDQQR